MSASTPPDVQRVATSSGTVPGPMETLPRITSRSPSASISAIDRPRHPEPSTMLDSDSGHLDRNAPGRSRRDRNEGSSCKTRDPTANHPRSQRSMRHMHHPSVGRISASNRPWFGQRCTHRDMAYMVAYRSRHYHRQYTRAQVLGPNRRCITATTMSRVMAGR